MFLLFYLIFVQTFIWRENYTLFFQHFTLHLIKTKIFPLSLLLCQLFYILNWYHKFLSSILQVWYYYLKAQIELSNQDTMAAGVKDDFLFMSFFKIDQLSHNLILVYHTYTLGMSLIFSIQINTFSIVNIYVFSMNVTEQGKFI